MLCLCLCVCELSQVKILLESRREIFCQMPDACRGDEACVSAVCVGDGACVNAVAVCFLQRMACLCVCSCCCVAVCCSLVVLSMLSQVQMIILT